MLGLTLADPTVIPLLAMPVLLVVVRVSAGGIALSVSDVVLFVAFWPAVVLGRRPYSPPMRSLLWLTAVYQACTLFTVVANPFTANAVEWFHAWFLTGGALIIGWALGRAGRGAVALTLLLLGVVRHRRGHHRAGGRPPAGPRPGLPRAAVLDAQELRRHRALLRGPRRLRAPAVDAVAPVAGPCRLRALYRRDAVHPVAPGHRRARRLRRRRRPSRRTRPGAAPSCSSSAAPAASRSWRPWSATRSTPGTSSTRCSSGSTGSRTPSTSG